MYCPKRTINHSNLTKHFLRNVKTNWHLPEKRIFVTNSFAVENQEGYSLDRIKMTE